MDAFLSTAVCVFLLMMGLCAVMVFSAIRVVPEHQRLVILRLGRYIGLVKGPGLVFVLPMIDQPITIDLRETVQQIPRQIVLTRDSIGVTVDLAIHCQVIDPAQSVIQVRNFKEALQEASTSALRAVIGDIPLANVMTEREHIITALRDKLNETTEQWGIKVIVVNIRDISVPEGALVTATRQMNLVGACGKVGQPLMPTGTALLELSAVADEVLMTGEEIVITSVEESRLRVARATRS